MTHFVASAVRNLFRFAWSPFVLFAAGMGHAAVLWEDEEGRRKLDFNTALKWNGPAFTGPDDPLLLPERNAAIGLFRARFDLEVCSRSIAGCEFCL
jgi:hypothetical protein